MPHLTRRNFLATAAAVAATQAISKTQAQAASPTAAPSFFHLLRTPDRVTAYTESATSNRPTATLLPRAGEHFQSSGIDVATHPSANALAITVEAPTTPLLRLHLRWQLRPAPAALYLGDAWERSYGDLAWRTLVPERVLPWYFAAHHGDLPHGDLTHAYGVRTAAAALCFWQVDSDGVSLWLDFSNGGSGVLLGPRTLAAATVLTHPGQPGETPQAALTAFCKQLCPNPRLPAQPIYGINDWYYAYGRNTAAGILRDTDLVAALAPTTGSGLSSARSFSVRPFSVVDDGWENNAAFPDMAGLATQIRQRDVHPGIWIRPLQATAADPETLLLPAQRMHPANPSRAYDPTIPEALDRALAKLRQVVAWRYDLVKHDFSTWELFGQWGFQMGATPTLPGWHFHDRSRTNAEIVLDLYSALRATAGDQTLLLGCNTIGHLSAGLFELQRTGDDTSGRDWERTRRMGINTLAFRLPQHRTFFDLDADCVGITRDIPWSLNAQWLDLLARSGTSLFLSPAPDAIGPAQKTAIRAAFALAAQPHPSPDTHPANPTDWLTQTTPEKWTFPTSSKTYAWTDPDGASPFPI